MLPFRVLYFFSDIIYYVLYYIIGYRKKVVFGNLKLAFPDKSEKEITAIAKKFYHHFIDVFGVEIIKSFTMPKQEMVKRYKPVNIELLNELEAKGISSIIVGAHYANWEWIFSFNLSIKYDAYAVFKTLKNPYFDKKIRETRGRFDTALISTKETFSVIEKTSKANKASIFGFISDQSPRIDKAKYWGEFMGVKVPIQVGVEVLAKKYNMPVVFYDARKIKRGYYECTLKLLTDTPRDFKDFELTDLYMREVEKQIHKTPEHYLWTHKRFKHVGKEPK
jgi:KDO2-lipid IV(A) lauroyltransferase